MGITRAQYLSPPAVAADGSPVLIGQVQGVKVDLESGIRILPDGTLRIAPEQINFFVKTNNAVAYNNYIWPTSGPPNNSVPVAESDGTLQFWTIGQNNGPGNPIIGTVYSVDVSGGATGLTFSGGPVTSAGVITMAGVLDVDNGGTGATTPGGARDNLGAGTVRLVGAGPGLESIPIEGITINGSIYVPDSGVVPGIYESATIAVDVRGFVTAASSNTVFPIGTQMVFLNVAAPPSWTKNTNLNDYALRLVSGDGGIVGGQTNFSTAFAPYTPSGNVAGSVSITASGNISSNFSISGGVQGTTLDRNQLAPHEHGVANGLQQGWPGGFQQILTNTSILLQGQITFGLNNYSGPQSHSHGFSGSISGNANFNGNTGTGNFNVPLNGNQTNQFTVRYVDIIACTKTSP